jgi:hypothetical protein
MHPLRYGLPINYQSISGILLGGRGLLTTIDGNIVAILRPTEIFPGEGGLSHLADDAGAFAPLFATL